MMLDDVNVKEADAGTEWTEVLPVDTASHLGEPAWHDAGWHSDGDTDTGLQHMHSAGVMERKWLIHSYFLTKSHF